MITVHLSEPLIPAGAKITAEIKDKADITFLGKVITSVYEEADKASASTPGERLLGDRIALIEKAITSSLPSIAKLEIANEAASR